MCYKAAPPSERNELNLSLLSSVPESEIGTYELKDLGRPLRDFRAFSAFGREINLPKSGSFFDFVKLCPAETAEKVTFPNLPPTPERVRKPKAYTAAHLSSFCRQIW